MQRVKQILSLVLVALAVVVYVTTDSVVATAVTMCLYRGFDSFVTAVWIFFRDKNRWRACVCGIFMFATGIWQGASSALLSLLVLVAVEKFFLGRQPELDIVEPIVVRLLGGIVLSSIAGLLATILAVISRQSVWVSPRLRSILDDRLCVMPVYNPALYFNYATFIVSASLTCVVLVPMYFALVHGRAGMSTLAFPLAAFGAYLFFAPRVVAATAEECWSDVDSEPAPTSTFP